MTEYRDWPLKFCTIAWSPSGDLTVVLGETYNPAPLRLYSKHAGNTGPEWLAMTNEERAEKLREILLDLKHDRIPLRDQHRVLAHIREYREGLAYWMPGSLQEPPPPIEGPVSYGPLKKAEWRTARGAAKPSTADAGAGEDATEEKPRRRLGGRPGKMFDQSSPKWKKKTSAPATA